MLIWNIYVNIYINIYLLIQMTTTYFSGYLVFIHSSCLRGPETREVSWAIRAMQAPFVLLSDFF